MPATKTKTKAKTKAKSRDAETVKVARTPHDRIVADIIKEYGDVIISGSDLVARQKVLVPIGPAFDFAHNGGWQEGTFVVLSGPPRCGKTTTAIHAAGKAQRPEYGGFKTVYANAEARLEPRDLEAHAGILTDPEHFSVIQSSPPQEDGEGNIVSPGKILTAKDFLGIVERFLLNTVRRFIIIDSVSAMVGESEWNDGLGYGVIAESQRLFSQFMRRMAQVIATNRHILVGIVHLYSNAGGGPGPKWLEKMSNSAQYGLATKFRSTHFEPWTLGSDKTIVGQIGHWKCERSPLGQPGVLCDSYLRYGSGIDEVQEIIRYAIDLNLIEQGKSWFTMKFVEDDEGNNPQAHGAAAIATYLNEHPDHFAELRRLVYEGLGLPL